MATQSSKIEWTESTWNPVRGCTRVSEGCRFCYAERIAARFSGKGMALEPLLGALPNLELDGIDWVIVGGESGPGARKMEKKWVIDIRNQCADAKVPFFFKQWGGKRKSKTGRKLDGQTYDEMPG